MELISLKSPTLSTIPSSLSRSSLIGKPLMNGQVLKFQHFKKYPDATKLKFLCFQAQALGTTKSGSEAVAAVPKKDEKDESVIFVAGATGKVGSRAVRELLKLGFQVRAGVRSAQRAETLVQSVKEMKLDANVAGGGTQPVEKLEIVECDLEQPDRIRPALGKASVVLCCIGASEKEVFDITGPYRIDYQATKNLIDAAAVAKVSHFIMVSSLGTNKIGFPAAILNLFWGVLVWKRKAEEALIASGVPYTIVRPGGMERPTDAYKKTHNLTLSLEDTLFGGQVSNLQVAELISFMAKNRNLSYCKVVEAIAETTAPLTPFDELLAKIPSQRAPPKEPDAKVGPDPEPSKAVISAEKESPTSPTVSVSTITDTPSIPLEKESAPSKPMAPRPLSPYAAYDDLKPPTSPTPTPPTHRKEVAIEGSVAAIRISDIQTSTSGETIDSVEEKPAEEKVQATRPLSPYFQYEDLKPPTSPSPTPPVGSSLSTSSMDGGIRINSVPSNNTPQPPSADKPTEKEQHTEPKLRPLSPFAMYDDLKPPSSPIPLPRTY